MNLDPVTVGTIIGSILIALLGSGVIVVKSKDHWKSQGRAEVQSNDVTIKHPVPLVTTKEKPEYVTRTMLESHLTRIDTAIRTVNHNQESCQAYQNEQRGRIHNRLDDQVKCLARMEGTLEAVKETSTTLLNLALQTNKPKPRA